MYLSIRVGGPPSVYSYKESLGKERCVSGEASIYPENEHGKPRITKWRDMKNELQI